MGIIRRHCDRAMEEAVERDSVRSDRRSLLLSAHGPHSLGDKVLLFFDDALLRVCCLRTCITSAHPCPDHRCRITLRDNVVELVQYGTKGPVRVSQGATGRNTRRARLPQAAGHHQRTHCSAQAASLLCCRSAMGFLSSGKVGG